MKKIACNIMHGVFSKINKYLHDRTGKLCCNKFKNNGILEGLLFERKKRRLLD